MEKIFLSLLLIMILAGCSGDGIFYTLENEEKIVDANNMGDTTPLNNMFVYTAGSSKYYVTNGSRVWHSLVGADTNSWDTYPVPAHYNNGVTFPSIALLDDELYATVMSIDSNYRSGLLKYNSSSEEWIEIFYDEKVGSGSSEYYYSNMYLFDTDQGLYINKVTYYYDDNYEVSITGSVLYFYTTAEESTLAASSELSSSNIVSFPGWDISDISSESEPQRIVDIISGSGNESYMIYNLDADNSNNNEYGVLAYSATDPKAFLREDPGFTYDYISIYYSSNQDMVFMGTASSNDEHPILYKTGGTWYSKLYNQDYQFSTFCDIEGIQSDTILAGTRAFVYGSSSYLGNGYFEIDLSSSKTDPTIQENTFSDDDNYGSSDLEDATLNSIFYDGDNQRLYATTSSYGLWLNTSNGTNREWSQE